MRLRIALVLLVLCSACQSGLMPCPRPEKVKLRKSFRTPSSSLISRANAPQKEEEAAKSRETTRPVEGRYVHNVSVEEWDCPKPGSKRYMPKSVKDNIKKNRKRFETEKEMQLDSLSTR